MALDLPARLAGRYRVLRPIGQGSIAQVVEAHDEERGATVAIKILYPNLFSNQVIADRFRREALVVRRIEHAHVIRIHDVVEADNLLFLVMRGGGTVGGGNTRQRWPLCEWETYRVLPGQTLTIEEHLDVDSFYARPGPAKLTVDVDFREANPDGTCAAREYKLGLPTRKVIIAGRRR